MTSAVLMVGSDSDRLQGESGGRTNQKFIARFMLNKPLKKGAAVERDCLGAVSFFPLMGCPCSSLEIRMAEMSLFSLNKMQKCSKIIKIS